MKGSARLWAVACVVALAATASLAVVLKAKLRAHANAVATMGAPPPKHLAATCAVPKAVAVRALAEADDPPVILWAVGEVRLFVDNAPAYSAPDAPRHFKVGEHTLRVEATGAEPIRTRFQLDAFTPALFHAQREERLGLSLVRLGSACASCAQPMDLVKLQVEPSDVRPAALVEGAAGALRRDEWLRAAAFLRGVPDADRGKGAFHRLASVVYADGLQPELARTELGQVPDKQSPDLSSLLARWDALQTQEKARRGEVVRARWNKVTERFQGLIGRFNTEAPGPTATASRRLAELSAGFERAQDKGDSLEEERLLAAAEQTLLGAVVDIRAARPEDCDFQAAVVAKVMQ
jgi:hypothetical protein